MSVARRVYGAAQFGATSAVLQGSTTPGDDVLYTRNLVQFVKRDGLVELTATIAYTGLTGGGTPAAGDTQVRLPGVPLPAFQAPLKVVLTGGAVALGAANSTVEALIVNVNGNTILQIVDYDNAGGTVTNLPVGSVPAAGEMLINGVYPTPS